MIVDRELFQLFMTDIEEFKNELVKDVAFGGARKLRQQRKKFDAAKSFIENNFDDLFIEFVKNPENGLVSTYSKGTKALFITENGKYEINSRIVGEDENITQTFEKIFSEIEKKYPSLKELSALTKQKGMKKLNRLVEEKTSAKVSEDINSIVNDGFTLKGKRGKLKSVTLDNIVNRKIQLSEIRPQGNKSRAQRDVIAAKLNDYLRSAKNEEKEIINSLLDIITAETKTVIVEISGDTLISYFDLKKTARRKQIYNYWRDVRKKFYSKDGVRQTYKKFNGELQEIKKKLDDNASPDLLKLIDEFNEYDKHFEKKDVDGNPVTTLEYVIPLKSMDIDALPTIKDSGLFIVRDFAEKYALDFKSDGLLALKDEVGDFESGSTEVETDMQAILSGGESEEGATGKKVRDKEGQEQTLASMPEITARARSEGEQLQIMGKKINEFTQSSVDPLFYYAFNKDPSKFGSVVLEALGGKDEKINIKNLRKITRRALDAGFKYGIDVDDDLLNFIEELSKNAALVDDGVYYLPYSDNLETSFKPDFKLFSDFFETITSFLEVEASVSRVGESQRTQKGRRATYGSLGGRVKTGYLDEIEDSEDSFREFLTAVFEYYILPTKSKFFPFSEKIEFTSDANFTAIQKMLNEDSYPFFAVLNLTFKYGSTFLDTEMLDELGEKLSNISRPKQMREQVAFKNQIVELLQLLDEIFADDKIEQLAKIELGNYYNTVIETNNLDTDDTIFGEKISVWEDKYKDSALYPLEMLFKHIIDNEDSYKEYYKSGTDIGKIRSVIDDMGIVKSEEELQIINAHGEIRKMLGKPVYNNVFKTDNYDHVNDIMSIIKEDYNVSITAHEIENIVYEIDSMESIGRKYGVSSDVVYFLKANFR